MGSDVGIFWRGLRRGSGDGVGRGYGIMVGCSEVGHGEVGCGGLGRRELGRGEVGHGEVGHDEVGHRLMAEVSGFR
nr:hypothetical protein CFP56_75585 [Quercus suber]